MEWKSRSQLETQFSNLPARERLTSLYSLSKFWRRAVLTDGYGAGDGWDSRLITTPYGERCLRNLLAASSPPSPADARLALFIAFSHHDTFVDQEKTDPDGIRELLNRDLLQERIRLPHRLGRALYDRFNDTYSGDKTDHLMPAEVAQLLAGSPTGVYQLGNLVSGPLGLIDSLDSRYFPPSPILPLWHCSDTGCKAVHQVELMDANVPVITAISAIRQFMHEAEGPPSEWDWILEMSLRGSKSRAYVDIPAVLGDCIVGSERTVLLAAALGSKHGPTLRKILAAPPRKARDADGPADTLSARQSPEAQLQLLLVLPDKDLVSLIDNAVLSRTIKIPLGETREVFGGVVRLHRDSVSELSALGIRSAKRDAIVNLTSAVWRAYQTLGLSTELEWKVRASGTRSPHEALVSFERSRPPADSVRELILSSAAVTAAVCKTLEIPIEYARGGDADGVNRLLWKLGFNPMQFDDFIQRFHARLSDLKQVVLLNTPILTEDQRESVRAAGVNAFVSLEEFLDRLVSYVVWILASDHFVSTRFRYSTTSGRSAVERTLGKSLQVGENAFEWKSSGENALGTLLQYARLTREWVQALPAKNREDLERPHEDLPHYAEDDDLKFPFLHTELWADSDPAELQRFSATLNRIVTLVDQSDPANIRNGLDHFREADRFPDADKLLACVARLRQALETADDNRFLPKIFSLFGTQENRFGSVEHEFKDYNGRTFKAYGPVLISGLESVSYDTACLVPPGNLLGRPNSAIVFQLREHSEFSLYWRDYPRRRHIAEQQGETAALQNGASPEKKDAPAAGQPSSGDAVTQGTRAGTSAPD